MNELIFWKDGNWNECVGGFHLKSSIPDFISDLILEGLNPVGIKVNEDNIEIIVEFNEAYKLKYPEAPK